MLPRTGLAISLLALGGAGIAHAQQSAQFLSPRFDVWFYPAAGSGFSPFAPVFGAPAGTEDPDRLGFYMLGFRTDSVLDPNQGPYEVVTATLTVHLLNSSTFDPGNTVYYDPTPDLIADYATQTDGRPIELFGVGLRNGLTLATWDEAATPLVYDPGDGNVLYTAYPADFGQCTPRDAQSNLDDGFDTVTMAVAATDDTYVHGDGTTRISDGATLTFEIDTSDPAIQAYLSQQLGEGHVGFIVSSLHDSGEFGQGGIDIYPRLATKETSGVPDPSLDLVVRSPCRADINRDGMLNGVDVGLFLFNYSGHLRPADLNNDCLFNGIDVGLFLSAYSAGCTF